MDGLIKLIKIIKYMVSKYQYVNKTFVFKTGDNEGEVTRCTGTFRSEQDNGRIYLELTNGMPVPLDEAEFKLKQVGKEDVSHFADRVDLTEFVNENPEVAKDLASIQPKNQPVMNEVQIQQPVVSAQPSLTESKSSIQESKPNIFSGFSTSEMGFSMRLKLNLPDIKLIRAMYSNYDDKKEFVDAFSEYILSAINNDVIADSISGLLEQPPTKKGKK